MSLVTGEIPAAALTRGSAAAKWNARNPPEDVSQTATRCRAVTPFFSSVFIVARRFHQHPLPCEA